MAQTLKKIYHVSYPPKMRAHLILEKICISRIKAFYMVTNIQRIASTAALTLSAKSTLIFQYYCPK